MKLLVACDGSKNSLRAVRYAIRLVGAMSDPSRITLISVHEDVALRHASRFVGKDAIDDYLRDESEKISPPRVAHSIKPRWRTT